MVFGPSVASMTFWHIQTQPRASIEGGVVEKRAKVYEGGDWKTAAVMGNGSKFKLSSVLPNVFGRIKRMKKMRKGARKLTGSIAPLTPGEQSTTFGFDVEQNDFSIASVDSRAETNVSSPMRVFPQNKDRASRYSSSPGLAALAHHLRFAPDSPFRRMRGTSTQPQSPSLLNNSPLSDPGCESPNDSIVSGSQVGRPRVPTPQGLRRSVSVNSSLHFNSKNASLHVSRGHGRSRQSRVKSRQVDEFSWTPAAAIKREGGDGTTMAGESSGIKKVSGEMREQQLTKASAIAQEKRLSTSGSLGSSSNLTASNPHSDSSSSARTKYCTADFTHKPLNESQLLSTSVSERDSVEHETDGAYQQSCLSSSRRLSFTTDDNSRACYDTSFSSDEDFFKLKGESEEQQRVIYADNADAGYTSGEMVLTEMAERRRAAILRREAMRRTVRSDDRGRVPARFSDEEKSIKEGAIAYDRDVPTECSDILPIKDGDETRGSAESVTVSEGEREASMAKSVTKSADNWAREDLYAVLQDHNNNVVRREHDGDKSVEYTTFGWPLYSKEFFSSSRRSSRNSSPSSEVEKHTKGRVDYKTSSTKGSDHDLVNVQSHPVSEEIIQPLPVFAASDDLEKPASAEFETKLRASAEFKSYILDSILDDEGREEIEDPAGLNQDLFGSNASTPTPCSFKDLKLASFLQQQENNPSLLYETNPNLKQSSKLQSPLSSLSHERMVNARTNFCSLPSPKKEFPTKSKRLPSESSSPIPNFIGSKEKASRSPSPPPEYFPDTDFSRTPSPGDNHFHLTPVPAALKLDSYAVVKSSYNPYHDFRMSMVEMILDHEFFTPEDLQDLLQCYLSLNASEYHQIIVEVFTDIWADIFEED